MQTNPQPDELIETQQTPKIYFSQKIFGKPTKNRNDDPSMFQLLAWNNHSSIQSSDFKKKERFNDPQVAYMNMISKQPWISESQQNFINYNSNSIVVHEPMFREVQNYIHHHQSGNRQSQNKLKKQNKLVKKSKNHFESQQQTKLKKGSQQKKTSEQIHLQTNKSPSNKNQANLLKYKQKNNQLEFQKSNKLTRNRPQSATNLHKKSNKNLFIGSDEQSNINQTTVKLQDKITEEEQFQLIEKFKQTTRWIPNSSFTTYFGKPPFENYGRANTKPIDGGLVYGTYLYSHNVFPHRGANEPSHVQSYPIALMKAKSMGKLIPTQPKTMCKYLQNKINNQKERQFDSAGAIEPMKNSYQPLQIQTPNLKSVEKFGGTKTNASRIKMYE